MNGIVTIERVEFFMEHGGLAYHPGRETAEVGRIRTALALADAEAHAEREGWEVQWDVDPDAMWDDDVERETTDYYQYQATLTTSDLAVLGSLGSVDFGPNDHPETEPYARVVAAELASEAMRMAGVS